LQRVLAKSLGSDYAKHFSSFEKTPFAAASIGQVHAARLALDDSEVAVKIQFPGVKEAIESDLNNLRLLLTASALLPRGLYLENTLKVRSTFYKNNLPQTDPTGRS
jgi:aarF domain-containing kinase